MSVRAKFRVDSSEQTPNGFTVRATPVTSGSAENESFYKYTPGGSLILSTINADAAKQFIEGHEVYVDFTPVIPA